MISSLSPAAGSRSPALDRVRLSQPRSALALFAILMVLALATDPAGFLSTDVGGKLATLEAMSRRGDLSPDLGYWAESVDPDGSLYPMWSTSHVEGSWVNVTSLAMVYVALPLYRLGGAAMIGIVPVVGTVVAALAASILARRLGGTGRAAFWIVGLASPATIYALDFWEHSLGLALMLLGVVGGLRASDGHDRWRYAVGAGLAFGVAAAMRQEALVYGAVTGAAVGVRLLVGGRFLTAVGRGAAMLAATVSMLVLNALLEIAAVGSTFRSGRSAGAASSAGSDLATRIEEAVVTGASPFARVEPATIAIALVLVGLLVGLGLQAELPRRDRFVVEAGLYAIAALVVVDLFGGGLGFVPGLAATTPVAVLGATRGWATPDQRFVAVIALGSLPLVWAVQYTGGAGPQWGGRYILTTGALLVVLATVTFTSDRARAVMRGAAVGGALMTLVGVAWTVHRTHEFADAVRDLADRDEQVLVFHDPFLAREGGALTLDEQWLAAPGAENRAEAAAVLDELGVTEAGFVELDDGDEIRTLPGWRLVGTDRVQLLDEIHLLVTTWQPGG